MTVWVGERCQSVGQDVTVRASEVLFRRERRREGGHTASEEAVFAEDGDGVDEEDRDWRQAVSCLARAG